MQDTRVDHPANLTTIVKLTLNVPHLSQIAYNIGEPVDTNVEYVILLKVLGRYLDHTLSEESAY